MQHEIILHDETTWKRACRFLICVLAISLGAAACDNKSNPTYESNDTPTVIGEWEGTFVTILRRPPDSLYYGPVNTYFTFDDSTFSYYHYNDLGPWTDYQGSAAYDLTDSTIYLHKATDGDSMWMPHYPAPYDLTLTLRQMVMVRVHVDSAGIEHTRRIELLRVN